MNWVLWGPGEGTGAHKHYWVQDLLVYKQEQERKVNEISSNLGVFKRLNFQWPSWEDLRFLMNLNLS